MTMIEDILETPVATFGEENAYSFVGGNPINRVDPMGLEAEDCGKTFFVSVQTGPASRPATAPSSQPAGTQIALTSIPNAGPDAKGNVPADKNNIVHWQIVWSLNGNPTKTSYIVQHVEVDFSNFKNAAGQPYVDKAMAGDKSRWPLWEIWTVAANQPGASPLYDPNQAGATPPAKPKYNDDLTVGSAAGYKGTIVVTAVASVYQTPGLPIWFGGTDYSTGSGAIASTTRDPTSHLGTSISTTTRKLTITVDASGKQTATSN